MIDSEVHRRLKVEASMHGVKVYKLATALLEAALQDRDIVRHAVQKVRGEPLS